MGHDAVAQPRLQRAGKLLWLQPRNCSCLGPGHRLRKGWAGGQCRVRVAVGKGVCCAAVDLRGFRPPCTQPSCQHHKDVSGFHSRTISLCSLCETGQKVCRVLPVMSPGQACAARAEANPGRPCTAPCMEAAGAVLPLTPFVVRHETPFTRSGSHSLWRPWLWKACWQIKNAQAHIGHFPMQRQAYRMARRTADPAQTAQQACRPGKGLLRRGCQRRLWTPTPPPWGYAGTSAEPVVMVSLH